MFDLGILKLNYDSNIVLINITIIQYPIQFKYTNKYK